MCATPTPFVREPKHVTSHFLTFFTSIHSKSGDSVWMENDGQKIEYVMNDSGKVYIGGYRNVRGRPWIYGQFDDCVLPAACLLLEMSGLPHSERGNPVKVARALASMVSVTSLENFHSFNRIHQLKILL